VCYASFVTARRPPFLARDAFYWLTLVTPVIIMLVSQDGTGAPTLERAARCLLSTWFCTVVVGLALHLALVSFGTRFRLL
jgi:hypothetical protein